MFTLDNDKPKEECGVFGIFNANHEDVSHSLYYGLCALQHRGQESAGMAVCDTEGPLGIFNVAVTGSGVTDMAHTDISVELREKGRGKYFTDQSHVLMAV